MTLDEHLDGEVFEDIHRIGEKAGAVYGITRVGSMIMVYRYSECTWPKFRVSTISEKEYINIVSTLHDTLPFPAFVRQINERMAKTMPVCPNCGK